MNFLITPVLIVGLLFGPMPVAGECISEPGQQVRADCAVPAKANARVQARTDGNLDRQARRHADYYRLLMQAQKSANDDDDVRQFTVDSGSHTETERFQ